MNLLLGEQILMQLCFFETKSKIKEFVFRCNNIKIKEKNL